MIGGREVLAQGSIGLIRYSYQQVATSFPEVQLKRTPRLSVLVSKQFDMHDRPESPSRGRTSEDKVRRKE